MAIGLIMKHHYFPYHVSCHVAAEAGARVCSVLSTIHIKVVDMTAWTYL